MCHKAAGTPAEGASRTRNSSFDDDALGDLLLAAATLDPHAVDAESLLRLVAELPGLLRPGRAGAPVDRRELA